VIERDQHASKLWMRVLLCSQGSQAALTQAEWRTMNRVVQG